MQRDLKWQLSRIRWRGVVLALVLLVLLFTLSEWILRAREVRHNALCIDNLHKIGMALQTYLQDNDESWPTDFAWQQQRITSRRLMGCPDIKEPPTALRRMPGGDGIPGYGYNALLAGIGRPFGQATKRAEIRYPQCTIAVLDAPLGFPVTFTVNPFEDFDRPPHGFDEAWKRHRGKANYLFCDGHAAAFAMKDIRNPIHENATEDGTYPMMFLDPMRARGHANEL